MRFTQPGDRRQCGGLAQIRIRRATGPATRAVVHARQGACASIFQVQCSITAKIAQPFMATTHHSFRGSFSAVSTPILVTKYSFCSIFKIYKICTLFASLGTQVFGFFSPKFSRNLKKKKIEILQNFVKFSSKISSYFFDEILQIFEIRAVQNCENLVDLVKC